MPFRLVLPQGQAHSKKDHGGQGQCHPGPHAHRQIAAHRADHQQRHNDKSGKGTGVIQSEGSHQGHPLSRTAAPREEHFYGIGSHRTEGEQPCRGADQGDPQGREKRQRHPCGAQADPPAAGFHHLTQPRRSEPQHQPARREEPQAFQTFPDLRIGKQPEEQPGGHGGFEKPGSQGAHRDKIRLPAALR